MDYNQITRAAQSRKALLELGRAIAHLSSEDFTGLPLEDRMAHTQGYRSRIPTLSAELPSHPYVRSDLHLLRTLLEVYE